MTEKRFKWQDVYQWEVPAFLEVMNGLHEKNEQLKEEIMRLQYINKQLNHDLDMYEENNTNEVLDNLKIELTSRLNDCIEEFKE